MPTNQTEEANMDKLIRICLMQKLDHHPAVNHRCFSFEKSYSMILLQASIFQLPPPHLWHFVIYWSLFLYFPFLRHRLPDFPRCSVLRALLHHDFAHHSQRQRVPPGAGRDLLLLALLCGLDCTAAAGLEQVRARGSRHHLLSGLEDPDAQQYLLHRLPVHLLPGPAVLRHPLLLQHAAAHHQTGEILKVKVNVIWEKTQRWKHLRARFEIWHQIESVFISASKAVRTPLSVTLTEPLYKKSPASVNVQSGTAKMKGEERIWVEFDSWRMKPRISWSQQSPVRFDILIKVVH